MVFISFFIYIWLLALNLNPAIDPAIIIAIAEAETKFNPEATSPVGAQGLFQFMPVTVKHVYQLYNYSFDPYNPKQATKAANLYLSYLYNQFHDIDLVLLAWNWGISNTFKYLKHQKAPPKTALSFVKIVKSYVPKYLNIEY